MTEKVKHLCTNEKIKLTVGSCPLGTREMSPNTASSGDTHYCLKNKQNTIRPVIIPGGRKSYPVLLISMFQTRVV